MAHAYLIAQLDTTVPHPVVVNVVIYPRAYLSKNPATMHLDDAVLWHEEGASFDRAKDRLIKVVMGPVPLLRWAHPWIEAHALPYPERSEALRRLRNRGRLAVFAQRELLIR